MTNKKFFQLANRLSSRSICNQLPILENALVTGGHIYATNLEIVISKPINAKGTFLIPINDLYKITRKEEDFVLEHLEHIHKVKCMTVKGEFKFASEDAENYPDLFIERTVKNTFVFDQFEELHDLKNYLTSDDLRVAMTGVFFHGKRMVATDAHKLRYVTLNEGTDGAKFIMPGEALKYLPKKNATCSIKVCKDRGAFVFSDDYIVDFRKIDARFPDYRAVIPSDRDTKTTVKVNAADFLETLAMADIAANEVTHQVVMRVNGTVELLSVDLDNDRRYHAAMKDAKTKGSDIFIAFNGQLMSEVIKSLDTPTATLKMSEPNRAIKVNGKSLVMPVMMTNDAINYQDDRVWK